VYALGHGLKIRELWHLSRTPYDEVAFRSNKSSSGGVSSLGGSGPSLNRQFKLILRSAKISKIAFAVFGSIGAGIPFLDFLVYRGPESLVSAISLSLAISLAYVVFYSLQILPEFSNSQAFTTLYSLPMKESDFSLLTLFSFIRTFDYLVLGTSLMQISVIWILTHSIAASLLMGFGALLNAVFAAAIALWFSDLFYRRVLHAASRSKTATVGRLLFLVVWGFAAMSIGFLFNLLSYLLPFINDALAAGYTNPSGIALSILHPFAISLAITVTIFGPNLGNPHGAGIPLISFLVPFMASFCYAVLAFVVGRRTYTTLAGIAHSKASVSLRVITKNFSIKLRRPLVAQIVKDLRLASKNPSMAFLYALPVFVVFMLAVITSQFPVLHASSIIVSTVVGCSFTIMISTTLLNTEGTGLEYSFSLPVRIRQIIDAKTLVATLMFAPVPAALIFLGLSKELTSDYLLIIPVIEIIAVYAACMTEITLFFGSGKSRGFSAVAGAGIGRLVLSLAAALVVFIVPLAVYAIEFVLTSNHVLSLLLMLASAGIEFGLVLGINRKLIL
jgi:Membrane protein of 12 TMs